MDLLNWSKNNTMTNPQPEYLAVGEILRPHGIRGELRMRILTDYPERLISDVKTIYLGAKADSTDVQPYTIKNGRFHKDYLLLTLQEVKDRNDAESLRGRFVLVAHDDAVPLEDGEYYLYQIMGLSVHTSDGKVLGDIRQIIETGANDVYVVKSREYGEVLIPAHDETIVNINFDEKVITVALPEGLLPDTEGNSEK